jgi:hypothetical protein
MGFNQIAIRRLDTLASFQIPGRIRLLKAITTNVNFSTDSSKASWVAAMKVTTTQWCFEVQEKFEIARIMREQLNIGAQHVL